MSNLYTTLKTKDLRIHYYSHLVSQPLCYLLIFCGHLAYQTNYLQILFSFCLSFLTLQFTYCSPSFILKLDSNLPVASIPLDNLYLFLHCGHCSEASPMKPKSVLRESQLDTWFGTTPTDHSCSPPVAQVWSVVYHYVTPPHICLVVYTPESTCQAQFGPNMDKLPKFG